MRDYVPLQSRCESTRGRDSDECTSEYATPMYTLHAKILLSVEKTFQARLFFGSRSISQHGEERNLYSEHETSAQGNFELDDCGDKTTNVDLRGIEVA